MDPITAEMLKRGIQAPGQGLGYGGLERPPAMQAAIDSISRSRPQAPVYPGIKALEAAVGGIKQLALPRAFWSGINAPPLSPGTIDHARQQGWLQ
jgi:hypothetical protein